MPWNPPPRSEWVESLNSLGHDRGGAAALVSLDEKVLLDAACRTTGLGDFGDDWFREGLAVLLASLEEEAGLTLFGRLRARSELQRVLENRLKICDLFKRHPEIRDQEICEPLFVTGLARSGTTIVHELLWKDPGHRAPLLWEMMHPVAAPGPRNDGGDPRSRLADKDIRMMELAVPAFRTMHENSAELPSECIFIFAHELRSEMFIGNYGVPSYAMWMAGQDLTPLYDHHRDFLKLLQWSNPGRRWVLKAPSHLNHLDTLFSVYPDARVVVTHRDPLKVLASLCDLMATLRWMHCEEADHGAIVETMAMGYGYLAGRAVEMRESGLVPVDRVVDLVHARLAADPVAELVRVYEELGRTLSQETAEAVRGHLALKHEASAGPHHYSFADTRLDPEVERARYADYQRRFAVPSEV